jgi:DNA-binding cell septation regulator SpoVG
MLKLKHLLTHFLFIAIFGGVVTLSVQAQKTDEQIDSLKSYSACTFDDDLTVKKARRIKGVKNRAVETADGYKEVSRTNSYEILISYPNTDIFASIRPEMSEANSYEQDKKNVLENLKYSISLSRDLESNDPIKTTYNGFESYGLNRNTLNSYNTIGQYVLFNDADKTITTIYFFNAKPKKRKFQTIEEWRGLKEKFLNNYTRCINTNSNR